MSNAIAGPQIPLDCFVLPRHRATYQKALNGRKQPIRGQFAASGFVTGTITPASTSPLPATVTRETRRVRLTKAHTLPQAVPELRRRQTRRETDKLPGLRRCLKFAD